MLIKFLGFDIDVQSDCVNTNNFYDYLVSVGRFEIDFRPYKRFVCFHQVPDSTWISGLLITVKDQKNFCTIQENEDTDSINLASIALGNDNSIVEVNFFNLNRQNSRGLYQYYFHSCSTNQFFGILSRIFNQFKSSEIDNDSTDSAIIARNKCLRKSKLFGSVIVKPESFQDILGNLGQIKNLTFDISTLEAEDPILTPMRGIAKKRIEKIIFKKEEGILPTIITVIMSMTQRDDIDNLSVVGTSGDSDVDIRVRLHDNFESFGEYDFDDMVEHLNVDLDNFHESQILRTLLHEAETHNRIFGEN